MQKLFIRLLSPSGLVQESKGQVEEAETGGAGEDEEDAGGGRVQGRRATETARTPCKLQRRRLIRPGGGLKLIEHTTVSFLVNNVFSCINL